MNGRTVGYLFLSVIFTGAFILQVFYFNFPYRVFDKERYESLITRLKELGYDFVLPRDFNASSPKKLAVLVHDVDFRVDGTQVFIDVESKFNVKSAFFLRIDADYYQSRIQFFRNLELQGWEIGLHYESLTKAQGKLDVGIGYFLTDVISIRNNFNVVSTRAHGDVKNLNINNRWLYGNFTWVWSMLNLRDVTSINGSYISDTNGIWNEPELLQNHILVNLHTDWW